MAENPQKRPLGDENAGGAIDAQDASKPRTAAAAEAPTVELTKEVKEAIAFQKHANGRALGGSDEKERTRPNSWSESSTRRNLHQSHCEAGRRK